MISRHRGNFYSDAVTGPNEQRQDEVLDCEARFADEIAHQWMITQSARTVRREPPRRGMFRDGMPIAGHRRKLQAWRRCSFGNVFQNEKHRPTDRYGREHDSNNRSDGHEARPQLPHAVLAQSIGNTPVKSDQNQYQQQSGWNEAMRKGEYEIRTRW